MALFHLATIKPTKAELIAAWAPTQSWGPPPDVPIEVIGSYRFDDPDARVGMETHLVAALAPYRRLAKSGNLVALRPNCGGMILEWQRDHRPLTTLPCDGRSPSLVV